MTIEHKTPWRDGSERRPLGSPGYPWDDAPAIPIEARAQRETFVVVIAIVLCVLLVCGVLAFDAVLHHLKAWGR